MCRTSLLFGLLFLVCVPCNSAEAQTRQIIAEEFMAEVEQARWPALAEESEWAIANGVLKRESGGTDTLCPIMIEPIADVLIETRLRVLDDGRSNFGMAFHFKDSNYELVRYYDRAKSLEVLTYNESKPNQGVRAALPAAVKRNEWYRMKVAVAEGQIRAKLWNESSPEPDWQLTAPVKTLSPGRIALAVHDSTQIEFSSLHAWSTHPTLTALREEIVAQRKAEREALIEELDLVLVPETSPKQSDSGLQRTLHVVPYAYNDRHPVEGKLLVSTKTEQWTREVEKRDYQLQELLVQIPEPQQPTSVHIEFQTDVGKTLQAETQLKPQPQPQPQSQYSYSDYVRSCLDTLIEKGRDHYGTVSSPLFMAVLDADLLISPQNPLTLDSLVRLEGRIHRRAERGSNLWYDQGLLRALYRMTELSGKKLYAAAADDYIRYFFNHCYKASNTGNVYQNGMPAWGTHIFWDCYRDRPAGDGDGNGPHEILVFNADWENMVRVHPQGVRRAIEGIWQHHIVDKSTGLHNRHDDNRQGCDFAFSGGSFVKAFAALYQANGEAQQLQRAKTVAGWHWNNRNPTTNLTADCPGLSSRYDGNHMFTTVAGPHATALLEAYRLTHDPYFRDVATSYIKAYDKYAWNAEQQTYWAMLRLDGTPVPQQEKGSGYDAYAPYGEVDVWRGTIYSYEFTLNAAQAALQAYETTVRDGNPDTELLEIAIRWATAIEQDLPPTTGRRWRTELMEAMPQIKSTGGAYAEDYGRAISFFVHLYRSSKNEHHLQLAQSLADEAISKLYHNGVFLGHPAKPYYEATNGVGLLLVALLDVDSPEEEFAWAF